MKPTDYARGAATALATFAAFFVLSFAQAQIENRTEPCASAHQTSTEGKQP